MHCILSCIFIFVLVLKGSLGCLKHDFPCENGECIDTDLWCDSKEDCSDGSDEKYCKKSGVFNANPNNCPPAYFKCKSGPCIPKIGECDGYINCDDTSDETNCLSSTTRTSRVSQTIDDFPPISIRTTMASSTESYKYSFRNDSQSTSFSASADALRHSVEIVYSDLPPSDYSHQREKARSWLLSQRKNDFGWGEETPRALTALYLSDFQSSFRKNETDMLMVKQLEVQLSLAMARNGTKAMALTDLALYINAILASCNDPKNFYGENLVRTLRNGVTAAQKAGTFVNPSAYLTLCINNDTDYEDTRKLHDMHNSRNVAISRIDIQALVLLTTTCFYRNSNFFTAAIYDGFGKQFLSRINGNGFSGNVYEASLLAQALQEMKTTQPGLLEFILKQQQEDGSFGGILATYLALPVLSGRSFLQLNSHCGQRYITDFAPIEVLKHSKRRKIYVQYSLNYGDPPEITQTIQMQVPEGINFLDVMRLAGEINPKYRFMLDHNSDIPVVYSIGGIPNDAEKGMFWILHLASSSTKVKGDAGRLVPYQRNIKDLIPHPGDELVFWMRSI